MITIVPSILAADYGRLKEQVQEAQAAGIQALQIDVMDGHFVPNLTFGPGIVQAIRPLVSLFLDVHLMIEQPERYLQVFAEAGADRLIVHQETCPQLYRTLQSIRELGIEAGVALNPGTPAHTLDEVLELCDLVQVMTVNPGFGGQAFLPSQLGKIRRLHEMIAARRLEVPIAVDGGIDAATAPLVVQAGATVLIAGSSVYNRQAPVAENYRRLLSAVGVQAVSGSKKQASP
jgi:ribulose-phosphate 3-epimerase